MNIYITKPLSHNFAGLNESENFLMSRFVSHRQSLKMRNNGLSFLEISAGKFSNDEGMTNNLGGIEQTYQNVIGFA